MSSLEAASKMTMVETVLDHRTPTKYVTIAFHEALYIIKSTNIILGRHCENPLYYRNNILETSLKHM